MKVKIEITEIGGDYYYVLVNEDVDHPLSTLCSDNLTARDRAIYILEELLA
jgi:hypothetical protein